MKTEKLSDGHEYEYITTEEIINRGLWNTCVILRRLPDPNPMPDKTIVLDGTTYKLVEVKVDNRS